MAINFIFSSSGIIGFAEQLVGEKRYHDALALMRGATEAWIKGTEHMADRHGTIYEDVYGKATPPPQTCCLQQEQDRRGDKTVQSPEK